VPSFPINQRPRAGLIGRDQCFGTRLLLRNGHDDGDASRSRVARTRRERERKRERKRNPAAGSAELDHAISQLFLKVSPTKAGAIVSRAISRNSLLARARAYECKSCVCEMRGQMSERNLLSSLNVKHAYAHVNNQRTLLHSR